MKITLWLALSSVAAVSASVITLPVQTLRNPLNLNAESLTRRYLQKRAASSTTAPLTSVENDVIYTIPLSLGTPPQNFNVIIDTGSPITWVSASSCTTGGCAKTNHFNCQASSSCTTTPEPFNVSYVSGQSVAGSYVVETFGVGSLKFRGAAGIVTVNSATLPPTVDGLMGLWYVSSGANIPILNVLKNATALTQNIIGIWLQQATSTTVTAAGGEITFGGADTTRFSGEIVYVNCVGSQPWGIPVGGMTVAGTSINTAGATALIDTGTTAMLMPKSVADAINGAIPGAITASNQGGLWFIPCSGNTPITITFGGFTAKIPYTSLAIQSSKATTSQGSYCQSAAMFPTGGTATIDQWLIGDVFLTNVYSVFDFETNAATGGRIGFAQLGSGGSIGTIGGVNVGGSNGTGGTGTGGTGTGGTGTSANGAAGVTILTMQAAALVVISALLAML